MRFEVFTAEQYHDYGILKSDAVYFGREYKCVGGIYRLLLHIHLLRERWSYSNFNICHHVVWLMVENLDQYLTKHK